MHVLEAHDGDEAVSLLRERMPDLVLLDVMMPGQDGFEVLKEIRAMSNVPVIMLTVQASEADRVRGLDLGADDYIAKPFGHRELVSRVKAALRRAEMPPTVPSHSADHGRRPPANRLRRPRGDRGRRRGSSCARPSTSCSTTW